MSDDATGWVWVWTQPSWQRRFLTFVFWSGVLCTPLAVMYAYSTSVSWKLASAALPVLGVLISFIQRYAKDDDKKSATKPSPAKPSPATPTGSVAESVGKPAEASAAAPEPHGEVLFVTPHDTGSPADFAMACRDLGLAKKAAGWALICITDEDGKRVTMLSNDPKSVRAHQTALGVDITKFSLSGWGIRAWRQGWPADWLKETDNLEPV
jgi:hypothetical protein